MQINYYCFIMLHSVPRIIQNYGIEVDGLVEREVPLAMLIIRA